MNSKEFETSRMVDIIVAAGVGVGSFYNHSSGKQNLAWAVFLNRVEEYGRELEPWRGTRSILAPRPASPTVG